MDASDISYRLGRSAEMVCRHYLSRGRREGRYWIVGNAANAPGRSLFVRLIDDSRGRLAGRWQDAATGEYGDLLDIIRETCGLTAFADVMTEARRFLGTPQEEPIRPSCLPDYPIALSPPGTPVAARRLFSAAKCLGSTLGRSYLLGRGIRARSEEGALRFHPHCFYGGPDAGLKEAWPALIAAVTDLAGLTTGVHRTYLDPKGFDPVRLGKAPIESPKRSMGDLLGHGIRFGVVHDVMAAGEGIETVLSVRTVMPTMPMVATTSAAHLAGFKLPPGLRRLYLISDNDEAGDDAAAVLTAKARADGIETIRLAPRLDDFNDDLRLLGQPSLRADLLDRLARVDAERFYRWMLRLQYGLNRSEVGIVLGHEARREPTTPHGLLERAIGAANGPVFGNGSAGYFPSRLKRGALHRETK